MAFRTVLKCLILLKLLNVVTCKDDIERFINQDYAELVQVITTLQREVQELKTSQSKLVALESEMKLLQVLPSLSFCIL